MKLSYKQIKELKKLLNLNERDRILLEQLNGLNKEYNKLIVAATKALEEAEVLYKVKNSKPTKRWLVYRFREAFKGFLEDSLYEYLGESLYKIYNHEFNTQAQLINIKKEIPKSKEELKKEFLEEKDYWGMSYKERIEKNHEELVISIISSYLLLDKDMDSLIKREKLTEQIKRFSQKSAGVGFVTQATTVESKARDDVVNKPTEVVNNNTEALSGIKETELDNSPTQEETPVKPLKKDQLIAVWIAIKDDLTCDDCVSRNGLVYELDKLPKQKPPLHANCRCKLVYTYKDA